jgi:hypothetical protein
MTRPLALFLLGALTLGVGPAVATADEPARRTFRYAPAPADNPLKGLVPYAGQGRDRFPHSLEFNYLPLAALVVGERRYDWAPLERLLDDIAGRGHQAVFRVYLEYPDREGVIPKYLVDGGLKVHRYTNTNTQPLPPKPIETPDYEDPNLRACLRDFVAALGAKYDGDPRVGFLTAGLLGTWGEWHTYPRNDLWASKEVQAEVMDAYERAFRRTPVLLRYPAGDDDRQYAANAGRPLGYHDDSFAWATLDTGKKGDDWYFVPKLEAAGPDAVAKWKTHPIGGEIRPEAWGKVFAEDPGDGRVQDFARCVEATHATWLMDSGMFRRDVPEDLRRRAEAQVRRMGYEFHVPAATIGREGGRLSATIEVENRGVAPLYHDWRPELALLDGSGKAARTAAMRGRLAGLLPGEPARRWEETLDATGLPAGAYQLAVRVPNPLPKGNPLRFANREQDAHAPGWLSLGAVTLD